MAFLIGAFYRHSLLTPLTLPWASSHPAGRMRKIKFALLSEQFVARDEQHGFSLRGVNPILARTSSFFRRLLPLLVLRLSPPFHRTALCSSGGRGACTATSVLCLPLFRWPAAGRFGRATRSFSSLIGNFHRPVSLEDVNPLSLSLYIFIISI